MAQKNFSKFVIVLPIIIVSFLFLHLPGSHRFIVGFAIPWFPDLILFDTLNLCHLCFTPCSHALLHVVKLKFYFILFFSVLFVLVGIWFSMCTVYRFLFV